MNDRDSTHNGVMMSQVIPISISSVYGVQSCIAATPTPMINYIWLVLCHGKASEPGGFLQG